MNPRFPANARAKLASAATRSVASSLTRFFLFAALITVPLLTRATDSLETVTKSADEWVKLRIETTRLQTAWQEERTLVESMVTALNERAATAEEKRDLAKARTAQEREELDALRAKITAEGNDLRAFDARLKTVTGKLAALRPALLPRSSEALEMSFRGRVNPALPAGERMQLAMNVLNRYSQFNRSIIFGEDVVALDGAAPAKSLNLSELLSSP